MTRSVVIVRNPRGSRPGLTVKDGSSQSGKPGIRSVTSAWMTHLHSRSARIVERDTRRRALWWLTRWVSFVTGGTSERSGASVRHLGPGEAQGTGSQAHHQSYHHALSQPDGGLTGNSRAPLDRLHQGQVNWAFSRVASPPRDFGKA
jgi:hypothetical protein